MKTKKKLIDLFEEFKVLNSEGLDVIVGGRQRSRGDTVVSTPTSYDTASGGCDPDHTSSTTQDPDIVIYV